MKLASFSLERETELGVVEGEGIVSLSRAGLPSSMLELIARWSTLEREVLCLRSELARPGLDPRDALQGIIGRHPELARIHQLIGQVAPMPTTVLITGESGTGKEVVARAIHFTSPRAGKPFVAVNCAAIPESLLESELFGHVKGAFTGAVASRIGRFVQADQGTLFLDEIGDMPSEAQTRLLRVLQEGEFTTVGGRQPIRAAGVDTRFPTPGTGEDEWRGFLPFSRMPQIINPRQGFLVNWNSKPAVWWDHGDSPVWGEIFRHSRITERLLEKPVLTVDDVKSILPDIGLDPPASWDEDLPDDLAAAIGELGEDEWIEREALYQAWVAEQVDVYYEQIDREIDACREAKLFGDR